MCQILCLTSHDPAQRDAIIQRVWRKMAFSQKDGYGASWQGVDGTIGYHKRRYPTLHPEDIPSFVKGNHKNPDPFGESNDVPSDGGFLIIHGRMATGQINVANTHPFITQTDDGRRIALVHNGVVRSAKYDNVLPGCTCDSEFLLHAYAAGGIEEVENHIEGRYAFMYLECAAPTPEESAAAGDGVPVVGKKTLHVVKDFGQNLKVGWTKWGCYAIATTEYLFPAVEAEDMGDLNDNTSIVFTSATDYVETRWVAVSYAKKQPALWGNRNFQKETPAHVPPTTPAVQQHQSFPAASTLPAATHAALDQIDAKLREAEAEEIRRLEQEPIEVID